MLPPRQTLPLLVPGLIGPDRAPPPVSASTHGATSPSCMAAEPHPNPAGLSFFVAFEEEEVMVDEPGLIASRYRRCGLASLVQAARSGPLRAWRLGRRWRWPQRGWLGAHTVATSCMSTGRTEATAAMFITDMLISLPPSMLLPLFPSLQPAPAVGRGQRPSAGLCGLLGTGGAVRVGGTGRRRHRRRVQAAAHGAR